MKHRNLIIIISILVFTSCKESTKYDIKGNWFAFPRGTDEPLFREINFREDRVELVGNDLFKEIGNYQIENGKIKIKLNRDDLELETRIENLEVDTLLIFDSLVYHRNREIHISNFEEYELIGIPTNKFLSKERSLSHLIHFYRSDGQTHIRYQGTNTTLDELNHFFDGSQSKPTVVIFLGKGITLKDLKKIYSHLASVRKFKILLGTKREGISDTHIFKDKIEIWWDDLENQLAISKIPQPPPPPIDFTSKKEYLKKGGKEIEISNKNDLRKIELLTGTERNVVSIKSDLSIINYFKLKEMIIEKKKENIEIITELK